MDKMKNLLEDCLREEANGYLVTELVNSFPTVQVLICTINQTCFCTVK